MCANRAERGPLVLLVDDAQWVDDPSLAWLGYLARRAADLALLLVLGLRSGDPSGEHGELERLVRDDRVERMGAEAVAADGAERQDLSEADRPDRRGLRPDILGHRPAHLRLRPAGRRPRPGVGPAEVAQAESMLARALCPASDSDRPMTVSRRCQDRIQDGAVL